MRRQNSPPLQSSQWKLERSRTTVRRSNADVAWKEGYHWGGGCWNNSDTDIQPNDPVQTESTHGEGGDCSGFTFKTWALENGYGVNGKQTWNDSRYIHGPYSASSFKTPPAPQSPTWLSPTRIRWRPLRATHTSG